MPSSIEPPPATGLDRMPVQPPMLSRKERWAYGKSLRDHVPRSAHADWEASPDRPDPVALLEESSRSRVPQLVPIRYGRMLRSPFAFFRGSAVIMAHDLAATPTTGLHVQLCGDAHLMNFGLYASPERRLLFDINDFDETLPGPWEWDVKRLATSCILAARCRNRRRRLSRSQVGAVGRACVHNYRRHMRTYAKTRFLDVWYSRVDADAARRLLHLSTDSASPYSARGAPVLPSHRHLTTKTANGLRLIDRPPLVRHVDDAEMSVSVRKLLHGYLATLQDDRRSLVERYRFADLAIKVVGVGSVGTRCFVVLLDAGHGEDPLFLQVKEAEASVLERVLGPSRYPHHGHRVVNGQRLMQSASDLFLGWASDGVHDYYIRQLREVKAAADPETMSASHLHRYARLCGWVLARAHARSGDAASIAGYLGKSAAFDDAVTRFAFAYADRTRHDYKLFRAAVDAGRLPAERNI